MADRAFDTAVQSDYLTPDGNFESFISSSDPIQIQLVFGETVTLKFHVDSGGTTDDIEISVFTGRQISTGNTLDGVTSTTDVELDTAADGFSTDDDMNGILIAFITSGNARGQVRLITDSVAADDGVVMDHATTGAGQSAGDPYALYLGSEYKFQIDMSSAQSETNPLTASLTIPWLQAEWILVRARLDPGGTDTHRIRMSYQKDSGPA